MKSDNISGNFAFSMPKYESSHTAILYEIIVLLIDGRINGKLHKKITIFHKTFHHTKTSGVPRCHACLHKIGDTTSECSTRP